MKRHEPLSVGNLLSLWIDEDPQLQDHLLEVRAIAYIQEKYTLFKKYIGSASIRNRVMYLQITSAPLRTQLLMSRKQLVDEINHHIGVWIVDDIKIY